MFNIYILSICLLYLTWSSVRLWFSMEVVAVLLHCYITGLWSRWSKVRQTSLKLAAFFPPGPLWQIWLDHCTHDHRSLTTLYACDSSDSTSSKNDRNNMTSDGVSAVKQQSNPIIVVNWTYFLFSTVTSISTRRTFDRCTRKSEF